MWAGCQVRSGGGRGGRWRKSVLRQELEVHMNSRLLSFKSQRLAPTFPLPFLEIESTHYSSDCHSLQWTVGTIPAWQIPPWSHCHTLTGRAPAKPIGILFSYISKCQSLPLTHHVCICIFGNESKQRHSVVQYLTLQSNTYNVWLRQ